MKAVTRADAQGNPLLEEILTTPVIIKTALQKLYDNLDDVRLQVKICDKLDELAVGEPVELEDAEFSFVKRHCQSHAPYMQAIFIPFFDAMDEAEK